MLRYGPFLILAALATDFGLVSSLVPLTEFFPYGPSTDDDMMPPTDVGTVSTPLQTPFQFLGTTYNAITLEVNGVLTFGPGYPYPGYEMYACDGSKGLPTVPLIAPFYTDVNTGGGGSVYYREETKDTASLTRVSKDACTHFRLQFSPTSLFITTWVDVPPFYGSHPPNTFQAVLASDGTISLVYFLYNKLQWGIDDYYHWGASVGFAPGDGMNYHQVSPYSCTDDILQVGDESNVDHSGQYIFRVETAVVGPMPLRRRKFRKPTSSRLRNTTQYN